MANKSKTIPGKLVIVGDGNTGKTCLLVAYTKDQFQDTYVPTVFESYVSEEVIEGSGIVVDLSLWDTAGQDDYDRLRPLSYPDTDVILLCYTIDNPDSKENVEEKWIHEVRHFCPKVPVILVGNKKDMRNDPDVLENLNEYNLKPVTYEEGYELSQKIGAYEFFECSSKTRESVGKVFQSAARAIARSIPNKRRRFRCALL